MADVDINNLEKYLLNCLTRSVDVVAENSLKILTDYIQKNWYNSYDPKNYERTYDFLRSASKTETTQNGKDSVKCLIYFDRSKIKARFYGKGQLNPHASFSGADVSESIPAWIESGHNFIGRGYEQLGSMDAMFDYLEKNFAKMVQKELKKMGLQVKVVS